MRNSYKGWVYIITTETMPKLVKVGFTTKDPELRAKELTNTGNPYPHIVVYEVLVNEPRNIEQKVHKLLKNYNYKNEWFECSIETAVSVIRSVCNGTILLENCRFVDKSKSANKYSENERKRRLFSSSSNSEHEEIARQWRLNERERQLELEENARKWRLIIEENEREGS